MPPVYQTTIEKYPLEKAKVAKKTIASCTLWLAVFIFVILPLNIFFWNSARFILLSADFVFVIIFVIVPIYQYQYYKKYFYDVRSDFLVIKKGVIMVREIILDYDKLQDVYMDQDILDRIFGLWDVHVSTATSMSGAEAHIDGVNHDNAIAVREAILSKIRSGKQKNG